MDVNTVWQNLWHTSPSETTAHVIGKPKQQDFVAKYTCTPATNPWIDLTATAFHSKSHYDRHYSIEAIRYKNDDKHSGFRVKNLSHFETGAIGHRLLVGMDHEKRQEDGLLTRSGVPDVFGSLPNAYVNAGVYGHLESSFMNGGVILQLGGRGCALAAAPRRGRPLRA